MDSAELTRRGVIVAAVLVPCAWASMTAASPAGSTLGEVIRRNTEARGGAPALDQVRSVLIDVELDEGGQRLNLHYAANTDGLVRVDIYAAGKNVYAEGIDKNGYWMWPGDGDAKPGSEGGRAALLNGAENRLIGWHRSLRADTV